METCNKIILRQARQVLSYQRPFKAVRKRGPASWRLCAPSLTICSFSGHARSIVKASGNIGSSGCDLLRHCYISSHNKNDTIGDGISDSFDSVDRHVCLGAGAEKDGKPKTSDVDYSNNHPSTFSPRTALILTKLSRYQFERQRHAKDLSETEFRHILEKRGSDYTMIKYHHNVHKSVEEKLVQALETRGVEVKKCQRFDYTDSLVEWADIVITAGGDGTFLLGASKIKNRRKPIMGVNTDPTRSEGHLCLPKHWSLNVDDAIQFLLNGKVGTFLFPQLCPHPGVYKGVQKTFAWKFPCNGLGKLFVI